MTNQTIANRRLHSQYILGAQPDDVVDVVRHLCAVQGQDYLYSLWALGLRTDGSTETSIEAALAERRIIRTWPLRGTVHYVTAADARWMVKLSAERVLQAGGVHLRRFELDEKALGESRRVIVAALQENQPLARKDLNERLNASGISTKDNRGYHILLYHALRGLIGLGPRVGKQQSVILIDEWLPPPRELMRDEALAELTLRYFASRGPATLKDFAWWSGLATADARAGLDAVSSRLTRETVGGVEYWSASNFAADDHQSPIAQLLPFVDEYLVAYEDRSAVIPAEYHAMVPSGNVIFNAPVLIDGQVVGAWTRKLTARNVHVSLEWFRPLSAAESTAVEAAAAQLGAFLGLPVELDGVS